MADTNPTVGHYYIGESTLDEMHESISEGIFPFLTFNMVDTIGTLISSVTIPHARFRDVDGREDLIEVTSSDCRRGCDECNGVRNTMFISRQNLKQYILRSVNGMHHYLFEYRC